MPCLPYDKLRGRVQRQDSSRLRDRTHLRFLRHSEHRLHRLSTGPKLLKGERDCSGPNHPPISPIPPSSHPYIAAVRARIAPPLVHLSKSDQNFCVATHSLTHTQHTHRHTHTGPSAGTRTRLLPCLCLRFELRTPLASGALAPSVHTAPEHSRCTPLTTSHGSNRHDHSAPRWPTQLGLGHSVLLSLYLVGMAQSLVIAAQIRHRR